MGERVGVAAAVMAETVMDILERPEPWHDVPAVVDDFLCLACAPWHILQSIFPLRYFTSWCHVVIVAYLVVCLTHIWQDSLVQGALWVLALYLPPSSLAIMLFSAPLRGALLRSCGAPLCSLHQFVTHFLPSILVFLLTTLPRPHTGPWTASALFIAFMLIYNVVLHVVWHESALDNYYLLTPRARIATLVVWGGSLLWACGTAEGLFALAGSSRAGPRF
jgi:hypothetical protein